MCEGLSFLGLGPLEENAFSSALSDCLVQHVRKQCAGNFSETLLQKMQQWMEQGPVRFARWRSNARCVGREPVQEHIESLLKSPLRAH